MNFVKMLKWRLSWLIIVFSSFLIFFGFTKIPQYLAYDEVEFAKLALSLTGKDYTVYSPLATGHSTFYFYILLFSLKIFGINTFALRLPAAVFGLLSIFVFYKIIETIFEKKENSFIPNIEYSILIPVFILATSRWFINFSRFAFETTLLLFLELLSLYFLFQCFKTLKWRQSFFSGLFAGLAYISYTPGRVFFALPLFFLVLNIFAEKKKQNKNTAIKQTVFFLIPFVIIIMPLTAYFLTSKDTRIDQLFFWRNHEMSLQEKINGTMQNFSSLTLMFFSKGDMNGRHNYPGKPALNPILGLLFIIGLFQTIKQWNNKNNKIFLAYFFLSITPSLAIYPWENPSMLRTFTVLPSVAYFIGQAISGLHIYSKKIFAKKEPVFFFVISAIILFSSFYEIRTYFKYQSLVFKQSFEVKYPLSKAVKIKNLYEKINQ